MDHWRSCRVFRIRFIFQFLVVRQKRYITEKKKQQMPCKSAGEFTWPEIKGCNGDLQRWRIKKWATFKRLTVYCILFKDPCNILIKNDSLSLSVCIFKYIYIYIYQLASISSHKKENSKYSRWFSYLMRSVLRTPESSKSHGSWITMGHRDFFRFTQKSARHGMGFWSETSLRVYLSSAFGWTKKSGCLGEPEAYCKGFLVFVLMSWSEVLVFMLFEHLAY